MSKLENFCTPLAPDDKEALRQALAGIADMISTRIEAGGVESIAVMFVGTPPKARPDTLASLGSRYLVRAEHLDYMQDIWNEMIKDLSKHHGVTPEEVRADRAQSAQRIERENK